MDLTRMVQIMDLTRMVQIDVLEKPIQRIKETCAMMGIAEKFDRAFPDLETFLEAEVARGETSETKLIGLRRLNSEGDADTWTV
jgi:hypothetical protein